MPGKPPKKKEADLKKQRKVHAKGESLAQALPAGRQPFPIVALGASAGGLEALEGFFKIIPPTTGAAFAVISHLDPKHPSMMSELIGRFTAMQVHEVTDGLAPEPNHVYMIPPNRYLSIFRGKFQLKEQEKSPGVRMPIDAFLRSLAEDRGDLAVAIILSGTGTDGTLGLRALQAAGGIVFVQDPDDAKYDGMPRSAIQTGLADYVLSVKEIAEQLATLLERHFERKGEPEDETAPGVIQKVLMVLRSKTGHDFSLYRKSTVGRRIRRRMNIHNIKDSAGYIHYLQEHPDEAELLFKELLINVTNFFRDPEAFDALKKKALPELLRDKPDDYIIRVWVPGCATGEEVYSIAMVILEYAEETNRYYRSQIFATDMDEASIGKARMAVFPSNIALDVTEDRLAKFFVTEENGYRVRKDIREGIVFALQDIAGDPPFTKIDLVSCRNVVIYMEPELQKRIISLFHYGLNPGGILFLGPSESIGARMDLFRGVDDKWKIFQAKSAIAKEALPREGFIFRPADRKRAKEPVSGPAKEINLEATVHSALLSAFAPPAIIVNVRGDILYIYGDTAKYLTPAPGRPGLNIEQMAREGLRFSMRSALMAATGHKKKAVYRNVRVKINGGTEAIDLTVMPLSPAEEEDALFLFTFKEVPEERAVTTGGQSEGEKIDKGRMLELENELIYTRESLEATAEKAQAANEELKSANEELQSSNEELHSTNEELETSREELQSLNEELNTVNSELRSKMEQLSHSESDMKNLLDSTEIATVFLDRDFHVKRFNASATRVVSLIPSDVGRPIDDVTLKIDYPPLSEHARDVMDRLSHFETEVKTKEDAWFSMRIVPYQSLENVIDGVVMTFVDITDSKRAAAEREVFFENIVQTVRNPLLVLDEDLKIVMANKAFLELFRVRREETQGHMIRNLGGHEWNIPVLTELLSEVLKTGKVFEDFKVEADFPSIGWRTLVLNARKIRAIGEEGRSLILLAMENVTGPPAKTTN
ncbi:MAG: putative sensor protein [Deltaproteobacteria bacterium]|nr:putative sensor protein [Deltaproteobacteria bacterium]